MVEGAPKPGQIFAGKYRVERILGMGGMGYVLAAHHLQLDERVAIKMLLPERALHAETVARFLREGKAAVKIRSEHVGRVLDVAAHEGTPYIVMEYLDGCDLADLIEREGRLPREIAVDYVLQACEAIAEAHAARIVHRDLKPANLFLTRKPDGTSCIKVLDFGISKMSAPEGSEQLSMTKTSSLVGSPLYMSPEQLRSAKRVDERSDIWSIGVILFELMAGRPPFLAETLPELGALVLSGHVPDLRELVVDAPSDLALAVRTCLRLDPAERFPSVAELARTLAPFGSPAAVVSADRIARVLEGVARPTWTPPLPSDRSPRAQSFLLGSTALEATATADPTPTPPRRSRLGWAAAALCLVLGAGAYGGSRFYAKGPRTADVAPRATPPSATAVAVVVSEPAVSAAPPPSISSAPTAIATPIVRTARPRPSATVGTSATASSLPTTLPTAPPPAASSAAPTNGFSNDRHG